MLEKVGSSGVSESDSEYILMVEIFDGLHVRCKKNRKIKDDSKFWGLSNFRFGIIIS